MAKKQIKLSVIDEKAQHLAVSFARAGRVEVSVIARGPDKGRLMVHVYDGAEVDEDQEPLGCFDGTEPGNVGWSK